MEHPVRGAGFGSRGAFAKLDCTAQYRPFATPGGIRLGQPVAADSVGRIQPAVGAGNWATVFIWGRVHKIAAGTNLNGYLLESTLNFRERIVLSPDWSWWTRMNCSLRRPSIRLTGSERTPWAERATSGMNTPGNLA
jgi:hypothetical protein